MGGGIGMGNTCKPMAVSFQCMTKFTTNKKKKKKTNTIHSNLDYKLCEIVNKKTRRRKEEGQRRKRGKVGKK